MSSQCALPSDGSASARNHRLRLVCSRLLSPLVVISVFAIDLLGHPTVYGVTWHASSELNATLAAMVLLLLTLIAAARICSEDVGSEERWPFWALAPALALLASGMRYHETLPRIALMSVACALALALIPWRSPRAWWVWFAVALSAGTALRAAAFVAAGPDGKADMVPLLVAASDRLLRGESPYHTYHMPWPLPLTYLPGSLLPCLPFRALRIDIRWAFVAAHMVAGASVLIASRTSRSDKSIGDSAPLIAWTTFYLAPGTVAFDTFSNSAFAWSALAVMVAVWLRAPLWAGWIAGLALATTPLAAPVMVVLMAVHLREKGVKPTLIRGGRAMGVLAILVVPWWISAPQEFLGGVVMWFNDLDGFASQKWESGRTWARFIGFAGLFWSWGKPQWLRLVQVLGIGLSALLFSRLAKCKAQVVAPAALVTLGWFVLTNPIAWPYLPHAILPLAALCLISPSDQDASVM